MKSVGALALAFALVACGRPAGGSESPMATNVEGPSTSTSTTTHFASTTSSSDPPVSLPPRWSRGVVVNVVDGDTIDVRLEEGGEDRVRLIGINSREGGECFADTASEGLAGLILGETVDLEPDVTDRDQFGRLLRYVWTGDERLINLITVERGWALAREYPPDTSRSEELEAAQTRARGAGTGLWAADACGAAVPADVRIGHVEYDAPGDDNINQNGEWVEISNQDDVVVDLTGWVLEDESATHRFVFPDGFTLQSSATVQVFTGCGADTNESLYWCVTDSAVWNNSGDTAFLLDPAGNIVFSYAYE